MHQIPEVENLLYELFVFRRMIEQLPDKVGLLLLTQFDKTLQALNTRDQVLHKKIAEHVDEAILEIKFQEFDLEATKRERDTLRDSLNDD